MITLKSLQNDYDFFKQEAVKAVKNERYADALDAIRTAGTIAQNFCLCYADDELENLLKVISNHLNPPTDVVPRKRRFLFYDSFSQDNVMLSTQYVQALISWNVEFIYITAVSEQNFKTQELYRILHNYPKVKIVAFPYGIRKIDDVKSLYKEIIEYQPEKAFLQLKTEDIVGLLPWYSLNGIKRYYVEVTDHSFWFGVKAIDKCICFRNYGYSIAVKYRGLNKEQLLIQPFYSTIVETPFEGIPITIENGVKLFSGGRITKIIGEQDAFFKMVRKILQENSNTEFYYAGGGLQGRAARMKYAEAFVRDNHLEKRFHLLGQRRDVKAVAEKMDIFINTYPFGGGLMVQLAAKCGLPVVIYAANKLCSSIEEFLYIEDNNRPGITFEEDEAYYQEIKRLINDVEYRRMQSKKIRQYLLSPDKFQSQLQRAIDSDISQITPEVHDVDCEQRRRINIDTENTVLHRYHGILLRSSLLRKKKPFRYICEAIRMVVKSDKKYLYNTVKRIVFKK